MWGKANERSKPNHQITNNCNLWTKLNTYFGESQHIHPFFGNIFTDLGLHYLL